MIFIQDSFYVMIIEFDFDQIIKILSYHLSQIQGAKRSYILRGVTKNYP